MSRSQQHEVVGVQKPQLLHLPDGVHSLDDALAAIELAEAYALAGPPDESQRITLLASMGTRRDGRWASSQTSDAEPRQNGKGDSIQGRELFGLTVLAEQIVHTAHEAPTATQAFLRLLAVLESFDDLRRLVRRPRFANGEQSIEMLSGSMISYRTRTGSGLRGFDAIDLLVVDESQHLVQEHLAAVSSVLAVSPNPQKWFAGSGGLSKSVAWWDQRIAALRAHGTEAPPVPEIYRPYVDEVTSVGGRFTYIEHTAEKVTLDEEGQVESIGPDVQDQRMWRLANPGMGRFNGGEPIEYLEDELRLLGGDLFGREHLCVWDPPPSVDGSRREISAALWDRLKSSGAGVPSAQAVGVDVAPESESASIAVSAMRPGGVGHVEVVDCRRGTSWVVDRLAGVLERQKPAAVGVDASGPVQQLLPELRTACKSARVALVELSARSYAGACSDLVEAVRDRRVTHVDQDWLNTAVMAGRRRHYGDAWMWDRRVMADVTPLIAVTVARRAAVEAPPVGEMEPMFAFS